MKKFTYWRNAIIAETYVVEAESEEEALEQLQNGQHDPISSEWMDWDTRAFQLEHVEEMEPLYVMVKGYKQEA